jgi:hypothetical protein
VTTEVLGTAVLRDFPLRLWARSRQHSDEMLREFTLMLDGRRTGQANAEAPQALLDLASSFTTRFGPLLDQMYAAREQALSEGRDRMDSEVALVEGTPELLQQVRVVLDAVDEYCRTGDLLTLERSDDDRRLFDWTAEELVRQYNGEEPRPWPGPF